jgi:hypothetical protein
MFRVVGRLPLSVDTLFRPDASGQASYNPKHNQPLSERENLPLERPKYSEAGRRSHAHNSAIADGQGPEAVGRLQIFCRCLQNRVGGWPFSPMSN